MTVRFKHLIHARLGLALGLGLLAGPALAHHSFAMFDTKTKLSMSGTVKELEWTNPHITIWVYNDAKPGETPELWNFETSSPGILTRDGWTKRSLQPGDKVQIDYNPSRDGGHSGELAKVTLTATGKVLTVEVVGGTRPATN
jgi:hypothetical protein